jgi:hypothetical protein
MPYKTVPPLWRRAFLCALGRTANVTSAAKHAGIDPSSAYQHRKRHPHFATLWDQAVADARAAMADGRIPEASVATKAGRKNDKAACKPGVVRSSKTGHTCVIAPGEGRWNDEVEAQFFDHLAATGNVKASARAIGMSTVALYQRRKLWPAFDALWADTLQLAVNRLDMQLITAASNMLDPPETPVAEDMEPVSVDQAIRIVQLHHKATNRNGALKRHDWRAKPVDVEAVKAEIIRKARAISQMSNP